MTDYLEDLYFFWQSIDAEKFLRLFWVFLVFDFGRFAFFQCALVLEHFLGGKQARRKRAMARSLLLKENPLVSVIAPGKNEGRHIPALAESLRAQSYANLEIIVVDDGSNDDTPMICGKLLKSGRIDKFFRNPIRGGKASAANLALRYCRGKYVLHLDADTHLGPHAVENMLCPFYEDGNIGAVAGDVRVNHPLRDLPISLQALEYLKKISLGRRVASFLGILRIVSGAFGVFRKDVLDRIGGWDVGPGLDGDITVKFRKLGYRIAFEPSAVCYTNVPDSFRKLAVQRRRWDRSLIRFRLRKHRDILLPDANFKWGTFLAFWENIVFNLVLDLKWWIYIIDMGFNFNHLARYVLPMNYALYLMTGSVQLLAAVLLMDKEGKIRAVKLAVFLPLMPIYTGVFLRVVRTFAYLQEIFFKASYFDPWNPWKVSSQAKAAGL